MPLNERVWTGHVIGWIREAISNGQTIFQDATNDEGIKTDGNKTRFPDVLLFLDKIAGLVFNGWELKFPDTAVDDSEMLENALLKAKHLKSNSFVTWNGKDAIIWLIKDSKYIISSIEPLKVYTNKEIVTRNDLSDRNNYLLHEPKLKARLLDILHDLEQLYRDGVIRDALNISSNIVGAITDIATYLIPLLQEALKNKINSDKKFRHSFDTWKLLESSTLKILASSSRRKEKVDPVMVLAKFTYYKLIGKILFYLTLSENLSGKISKLILDNKKSSKQQLNSFFDEAKQIDYQAVFDKDFTDEIEFNSRIDKYIFELLEVFNVIDFRYLPNEVIGHILENLVPKEEKQKFGQYFTSEVLATLVSVSAISGPNDILFDPTSGTGTFLSSFYNILKYLGNNDHQALLNQIWGNDISHFPAVLSVINLYKQNLSDKNNFPRITRNDYFNILPGQKLKYPNPRKENEFIEINLPQFDAIISNFPFIQQEDLINKFLTKYFREYFQLTQKAFIKNNNFDINERSDYFVYCLYNSLKFLKINGYIAFITSNAWLGKDYGNQFKQFLLDNFSVRYLFRSTAEHWFHDSKVSTIFTTVQRVHDNKPTRFVTLNKKLEELFPESEEGTLIALIEELYSQINLCEHPQNNEWLQDPQFGSVYHKKDGTVSVSIVDRAFLEQQVIAEENWVINFLAQDPLQRFKSKLINPFPDLLDVGRGTRTGWDEMHILDIEEVKELNIEKDFLIPVLKTSQHLNSITYELQENTFLFVCDKPIEELKSSYPNAFKWIRKWSLTGNKIGKPLPLVFQKRLPYWYSLSLEEPANIFISINPGKKLFFAYSKNMIYLNQRLVAIRAPQKKLEILTALFNSVVSLLIVELNGVSRNLGALDLYADFFKTKMRIFNPELLSESSTQRIIEAFRKLSSREIKDYDTEFLQADRINFDKTILSEFGYNIDFLPKLYEILTETIRDRTEMKNR